MKVKLQDVVRELNRRNIRFSADHFWQARSATQKLETVLASYIKIAQAEGNKKAISDLKLAMKYLIKIVDALRWISEL